MPFTLKVDDLRSIIADLVHRMKAVETASYTGGVTPVTTATRPLNPTFGQVIADATRGDLYWWNGSAWQVFTRSIVARHAGSGTSLPMTTSQTEILRVSNVYLETGRLYELRTCCRAFQTPAGGYLRLLAGAASSGAGTIFLSLDTYFKAESSYGSINWPALFGVGTTGLYTIAVDVMAASTGTLWTDGGGYLSIEDLGIDRGNQ